jgi:L-alanine-DL-glutamate epimerase-like enolase superfamily enzyme
VRFECKTSALKVIDGKIKVPTGPGLGVELDPEYVRLHQVIRG